MNPERWSRIKAIFDLALDSPESERSALIHSSCSTDPRLEQEVLKLVHAHNSAGDFLQLAAADLHAFLPAKEDFSTLTEGMILSRRFVLRSFLSSGGMGEVYEAWDSNLNEVVALKTIRPYIAANEEVIARFKQEVRHAREVSHPHICRVHELFCDEDATSRHIWFLSMELLRGPTLLERVREEGGLPPKVAQQIAAQLLAGIEAAHARGLIHCDFKSSNVMLTQNAGETRAVITDFGLSLRTLPESPKRLGSAGTGTPGYMAPEQERDGELGPLADQYAFGVVLCEMMTGLLPGDPRMDESGRRSARQHGYPPVWDQVIRRCMQADPATRYPDMLAVHAALLPSVWVRQRGWIVAACALIVAAFALLLLHPRYQAATACQVCDIVQLTPDTDESETPSLSRDGRYVAYSSDRAATGNLDIFVQELPSGRLERITHELTRESAPSLSPDASLVAFRSERDGGGIYLATTHGQNHTKLLVPNGRNPKISPDGKSLLYWTGDPDSSSQSGKVFEISLAGSQPQQIASTFADARYPVWSSDGRSLLFTGCATVDQPLPGCFDWWIAKLPAGPVISTHAFELLRKQKLPPGRLGSADWKGSHVIFSAIGESKRLNLASLDIDPNTLQVMGMPQWLLQEAAGDLDPAFSQVGRIAFTRTSGALHIWQLLHAHSIGRPALEKLTQDTEVDGSPFVAQGGRFLVYARGRTLRRTVMLRDLSTGQDTTLVNLGTPVESPIIDRFGRWVAYQETESDGSSAIYAGERSGGMKQMCHNCTEPAGWFEDQHAFFYRDAVHSAVGIIDPETGQQQIILQEAGASLGDVSWSAVNGYLGFVETKLGKKRVYAVKLSQSGQSAGKWIPISQGRGSVLHPRWAGDGKTIFYISNEDGFLCIYGRSFNEKAQTFGPAFSVSHFHNQRASIDDVVPRAFNLSAAGDSLYFNLGEQNSTIQLANLNKSPIAYGDH